MPHATLPASDLAIYVASLSTLYLGRTAGDPSYNLRRALEVIAFAERKPGVPADLAAEVRFNRLRAMYMAQAGSSGAAGRLADLRSEAAGRLADLRSEAEKLARSGPVKDRAHFLLLAAELELDAAQRGWPDADTNNAVRTLQRASSLMANTPNDDLYLRAQGRMGQALIGPDGLDATRIDMAIPALRTAKATETEYTKIPNLDARVDFSTALGRALALKGDWAGSADAFLSAHYTLAFFYERAPETEATLRRVQRASAVYRDGAYAYLKAGQPLEAMAMLECGRALLLSQDLYLNQILEVASEGGGERPRMFAALESISGLERDLENPALDRADVEEKLALARGRVGSDLRYQSWADDERLLYRPDIELQNVMAKHPPSADAYAEGLNAGRFVAAVESRFGQAVMAFPASVPLRVVEKARLLVVQGTDPWQSPILSSEKALAAADAARAMPRKDNVPVVFLPDQELGAVPLAIVRDAATGRALIDDCLFVLAPSAFAYQQATLRARQAVSPGVCIFATDGGAAPLPFADMEAAMIAQRFPQAGRTVVTSNGAVTLDQTFSRLAGKSYWHFSTHGAFDRRDALDSYLLIGPSVRLSARDIRDQRDRTGVPRLVFLAACETGLAESGARADEFIGLPMALLSIGVPGVIASLWPVSDLSTSLITAKFYDLHMTARQSPPVALRSAQLWLRDASVETLRTYLLARRSADGLSEAQAAQAERALSGLPSAAPFADPRHWAAWTYFGA